MDDLVLRIDALSRRNTQELLAELEAALNENGPITQDVLIAAAYIAGIEDAITGTAGRSEYDLRRYDFAANVQENLLATGRSIGSAASEDLISQAREDR